MDDFKSAVFLFERINELSQIINPIEFLINKTREQGFKVVKQIFVS